MGAGKGAGAEGRGPVDAAAAAAASSAPRRRRSAAELRAHSAPGDCWLAIEGKVYDVSRWADHPGGRVLYSVAGTDATDSFRAFHTHSASGTASLRRFEIGTLAPAAAKALEPSAFEEDYRELYDVVQRSPHFYQAK